MEFFIFFDTSGQSVRFSMISAALSSPFCQNCRFHVEEEGKGVDKACCGFRYEMETS